MLVVAAMLLAWNLALRRRVEARTRDLTRALDDLKAGNPVQTPTTTPYGCGVKYKATN